MADSASVLQLERIHATLDTLALENVTSSGGWIVPTGNTHLDDLLGTGASPTNRMAVVFWYRPLTVLTGVTRFFGKDGSGSTVGYRCQGNASSQMVMVMITDSTDALYGTTETVTAQADVDAGWACYMVAMHHAAGAGLRARIARGYPGGRFTALTISSPTEPTGNYGSDAANELSISKRSIGGATAITGLWGPVVIYNFHNGNAAQDMAKNFVELQAFLDNPLGPAPIVARQAPVLHHIPGYRYPGHVPDFSPHAAHGKLEGTAYTDTRPAYGSLAWSHPARVSVKAPAGAVTYTKTVGVTGVIKQAGLTKTVGVTGVIKKLAATKTVTVNAQIGTGAATYTKTVGVTSVVKRLALTKTVTTTAHLKATYTKSVTVTTHLKALGTTKLVTVGAIVGVAPSTPMLLYWGRSLSTDLLRLERPVHYGNTGRGFTDNKPSDDAYIFPPENTQKLWDVCRNITDRYGFDFTFNEDGDCVLTARNNPHYVADLDSSLGGSPTSKTDVAAYGGTYIEYTGAVATRTKQVTAARIDLVVGLGASLGDWSVQVRRVSDNQVVAGPLTIVTTATSDLFYYSSTTTVTGSNPCVTTLYSGYYDTYNVEITSSGGSGGTVRRLDSLLLWHTDAATSIYSSALNTTTNALEVGTQSTMDEMRNYAIVVGRRVAAVTDSSKLDTNPENPVSEFVVQSAVDANSILNPAAENYIGFPKESIIYDTKITDEDFAAYLAQTFVYRQRQPKPSATVRHTCLPITQLRDPVQVTEPVFGSLSAAVVYVTGITHRFSKQDAITELTTTSYLEYPSWQPREDIDIDANFGGYPVANVNINYTSVTNTAMTNVPSGVESVSSEAPPNNDLIFVPAVPITAGSPAYLNMTGYDWPPIPGTVQVRVPQTHGSVVYGSASTIDDTSQSWITDQWKNWTVLLLSGTGSEVSNTRQSRTVSSNTATRLTLSSPWSVNPASDTVYKIVPTFAGTTLTTELTSDATSWSFVGTSPPRVLPGETFSAVTPALFEVVDVWINETTQNQNGYGTGTTSTTATYHLTPRQAGSPTPKGYWSYDPNSERLTVTITQQIGQPTTGLNTNNPYPSVVTVWATWVQIRQGSVEDWVGNNPNHHFMNVDYRDSNRRIYLPWKRGDTQGPTTGTTTTGSTTTTLEASGTSWTSNQWVGYDVVVTSGTYKGQRRTITYNDSNTLTWAVAGGAVASGVTFSIEGAYDRNSQLTHFDVRYRRLGPTSGGSFSDPYTAGSPFYDPYTSELGYLVQIKFDALVSGLYRISVRSTYDDTVVAWLTETTAEATDPEVHWQYFSAGSNKALYWDGVDQVGTWNRRQSEEYAAAAHGAYDLADQPVIGAGFYAWNFEERAAGTLPPWALISGQRDGTTGIPAFGQGAYAKWYVQFEAINDTLQQIADATTDPQLQATGQYTAPRVSRTAVRNSTRDGLNPTYHTAAIKYSGTANGGSTSTLTVSGTPWMTNQWIGHYAYITSGTGSGQNPAKILSNTSNTLTVATWTAPANGSGFRIQSHEALVYTHLGEPTRAEILGVWEWSGGGSWSADTATWGGQLSGGSDYDPVNNLTAVDSGSNWAQITYATSNTVNPSATISNQRPVLMRFAMMARPGHASIWTAGNQAKVSAKLTRHVHLRVTLHDQFIKFDGTNYVGEHSGTSFEKRTLVSRRYTLDDHTLTFVDSAYRQASTFKSAFGGTGTEWIFVPSDFRKDFRGIPNEAIQFGDYLQVAEVPGWSTTGQIAGVRSRLLLAFMNYLFYLSAYTQDRSGRLSWCIDRKFLDKSKILFNQYGDWWDPASPTTPATSSTYRNTWPEDFQQHHRRTVVVRQWLDEKNWQSGQRTKWGMSANSLADKLLRHKWEDHDPYATNLNGAAWPTAGTDDYSTWHQGQGKLDNFASANSRARELGTFLGNWTFETDGAVTWNPSVSRDFHPYYAVLRGQIDPMTAGRDAGAPDLRSDYIYFLVDTRAYFGTSGHDTYNRNTGWDAAAVEDWHSAIRDDTEAYVSGASGKKRFWVGSVVQKGKDPTDTVQANNLDYQRSDETVHYEHLRGLFVRGERPGETPKKIDPVQPYYINSMRYDTIITRKAYKNGAFPLYTTGQNAVAAAGWFDCKFRYQYNWDNGRQFPCNNDIGHQGEERLQAVNWRLRRTMLANIGKLGYDDGAWTGWKDDAQTPGAQGTPGLETSANYKLFSSRSSVFEGAHMPVAVGPELLTTRDQYFALVLVNERRTAPLRLP